MTDQEAKFEPRNATLREALKCETGGVTTWEPFRLGDEPLADAEGGMFRCGQQHYYTQAEVDERLGPYLEAAQAGVSDAYISERSMCSVDTVARWRRRRGIHREPGRPTRSEQVRRSALDYFGRPADPTWMKTEASPVRGVWEPPEFLVRQPLDYEAFAQAVSMLIKYGMQKTRIAAGLGVRPRDVELAAALWEARCNRR